MAIESSLAALKEVDRHIVELRSSKDFAYWERNQLVNSLAKLAHVCGHPVWIGAHVGEDWDAEWRNIVFIHVPRGQLSWHIHDNDLTEFAWIKDRDLAPWDGHTTPEKYRRLAETNWVELIHGQRT
jgi:hypothetical protein